MTHGHIARNMLDAEMPENVSRENDADLTVRAEEKHN